MKSSDSKALKRDFYLRTGALFFAFAKTDGTVHEKEISVLETMVTEKWLATDAFKEGDEKDIPFSLESVFYGLVQENESCDTYFSDFAEFYKAHTPFFTEPIKNMIFETASAIVNAFSGRNKSELVMLGKLRLLFTGSL